MRGRVLVIWGRHKAEYFLRDDWTGVMGLKGLMKLGFRRRMILRVEGLQMVVERARSIRQRRHGLLKE
jgi:hypothetical protein